MSEVLDFARRLVARTGLAAAFVIALATSYPIGAKEDSPAVTAADKSPAETPRSTPHDSSSQKTFDAKAILEHNQPWLRPDFSRLAGVRFKHVTGPKRLVEAFEWRRDGASWLEVLEHMDWHDGVGRRDLSMPGGGFYFFGPQSKFAQSVPAPDGGIDRYFVEHLRGTRMNRPVLDWGASPERFEIRKVQENTDGTVTATLVAPKAPSHLDVGVMFHYTSWAYVHDLGLAKTEVTIDPASRRILREVDYSAEGERIAEIDFDDWREVADHREVPLRIHGVVEREYRFVVDYRFQWRDEGLWILKESTGRFETPGRFDEKVPQRGEIVELAVNQTTPRLDRAIEQFHATAAELRASASPGKSLSLQGLFNFEPGKVIALPEIPPQSFPNAKDLLFMFDLDDPSSKYNHHVRLFAEVGLDRYDATTMGSHQLLLTFLDASGNPIQGYYLPTATMPAEEQSPKDMAQNLLARNSLWLAPGTSDGYSYSYCNDSTAQRMVIDEKSSLDNRRAVTLRTSFDGLLRSPGAYRVPLRFEGIYEGKPVVVAGFVGASADNVVGNGVSLSRWQDYMSFFDSSGVVVFEKETWRPLVLRMKYVEIQYRDYVEIRPGVSVPLRIVLVSKNSRYDWRFKVLDEKLWLFDRGIRDGKTVTSTKDIAWADGKAATTTHSIEPGAPTEDVKPFDFSRITNRVVPAHAPAVVRQIVAETRPWEHPAYDGWMNTMVTKDRSGSPRIRATLGAAESLKDAASFALTWISPDDTVAAIPGPRKTTVHGVPLPQEDATTVKMFTSAHGIQGINMASRVLAAQMRRGNASDEAKLEFLDATQDKGLAATLALAVVDSQGVIRSVGSRAFTFINYQGIYSGEQSLRVALAEDVHPLYLVPRYHADVYLTRIGSRLGCEFREHDPPLPWNLLFAAEDSRVWGYGLRLLQGMVNDNLSHRCPVYGGDLDVSGRKEYLAPHKDALVRLLKATKDPEWLVVLCQLVGHAEDAKLHELLLPLLGHPRQEVREAAAIYLCRLGDMRGVKLVLDAMRRELGDIPESGKAPISPRLTDIFVALRLADTKEVIAAIGETLPAWLRRPFVDKDDLGEREEAQPASLCFMLAILGKSKQPEALDLLLQTLRGETRRRVQNAILAQLQSHEQDARVCEAWMAGLEEGKAVYFGRAPHRPEFAALVARKVFDPRLDAEAFSAAVVYLAYDKDDVSRDALRRAYEKKLHAEDPALWAEVLLGLARRGDHQHLAEAFDLLVTNIEETPPASGDVKAKTQRENRIWQLVSWAHGIPANFPPDELAPFLHGKDADPRPAVREAVKRLLEENGDLASAYKKLSSQPGAKP